MYRTSFKFGNFLARVDEFVGLSELNEKVEELNADRQHKGGELRPADIMETVRYSFKIQDLSHGNFLGDRLWVKHDYREYPIRFKTKEEAYDALYFFIELYQRITGDTKLEIQITGKTKLENAKSDGPQLKLVKEADEAFTFDEDCTCFDSFYPLSTDFFAITETDDALK